MKAGFWDYVREAFNARPIGMFVPPNWIGLAVLGLLGLQQPGFWVLGAGLELGYLSLLATHPRFQRLVNGKVSAGSARDVTDKGARLLASLPESERRRYEMLALRCQSILEQQFAGDSDAPGFAMQHEGLGRLTWLYLRLLSTRQAIRRVIAQPDMRQAQAQGQGQPPPIPGNARGGRDAGQAAAPPQVPVTNARELETRLADLNRRLEDQSLGEDLRRSLTAQAELLQQRVRRRAEAEGKLQFLDAELQRIEEQVELIREQALLSTDPESFSRRIDEIGATLSGTADWIAEQQRTLGAMDDLLGDAPALSGPGRTRQSQ
jgi:hypothetical protein